jgi:hypothetical protein
LIGKRFGLRFLPERKAGRRDLLASGNGSRADKLFTLCRIFQGGIWLEQPVGQFAFLRLRGKIRGTEQQRQEGNEQPHAAERGEGCSRL